MLELPDVTLLTVAGVEVRRAISALRISMRGITFGSVKLLTHERPQTLDRRIELVQIEPLRSHMAYNSFVIYELAKAVDTPHCLLVQADGYVKNPSAWSDEFLNYDYVGAPWPYVDNAYVDPFGLHQRVGNGGFSLRSRHLLTTPTRSHVEWEVNQGDFYKHMNAGSYSEDGNICVHNRHVYEQDGCVFAPIQVAARFSRELAVPDTQVDRPFGFHRYGLRTGRPTKAPLLLGYPLVPTNLDRLSLR